MQSLMPRKSFPKGYFLSLKAAVAFARLRVWAHDIVSKGWWAETVETPADEIRKMAAATATGVGPRSIKLRDLAPADAQHLAEGLRGHIISAASRAALNRSILNSIPEQARIVLIGEASHGTEEFYAQRAEITRLLIEDRGFQGVICEADFPDMWRVNQYVKGLGKDTSARKALGDFTRFPRWLWRNTAFASFVEYLKQYNSTRGEVAAEYATHGGVGAKARGGMPVAAAPAGPMEEIDNETASETAMRMKVGIYGLDVYSMHGSAMAAVDALKEHDPELANEIEQRYRCLDKYGCDAQSYGLAVGTYRKPSCEKAVAAALRAVREAANRLKKLDGVPRLEQALQAEANAMVVKGAEEYYRAMFYGRGRDETWNLRDSHFLEVVKLVEQHIRALQEPYTHAAPRLVVWAHNSHLGDARATDMSWRRHEHNLGQLARQHFGAASVYNIGFTTHTGTVAAADDWGEPVRVQRVRPSMQGSVEDVMHRLAQTTGSQHFALDLGQTAVRDCLQDVLLERAIGVVYRPDTERWSHYFDTFVPGQFNLIIHVENSSAVTPLDGVPGAKLGIEAEDTHGDLPETFPEAL